MATRVVMEALSPTMEEGRIAAWLKQEGDPVKAGETLAEVETDKAVMELVARADGVLRKIVLQAGETAPVSSLVAVIAGADEDISSVTGATSTAAAPPPPTVGQLDGGTVGRTEAEPRSPGPASVGQADGGTVGQTESGPRSAIPRPPDPPPLSAPSTGRSKSSPLARRLAADKGVNVAAIAGTGPGGRVIKRDVEGATPGAAAQAPKAAAPLAPAAGSRDVPLSQIRKTIAKRLSQSIGPIPHFFLTSEIDMERAAEMREALKAKGEKYAVSFNDIVVKAVAMALREHGAVNAWWMDDHIRYHGDVHVGMAVAVEDGLITPVIRYADQKGIATIAAESRELAGRARARRLTPDEYTGATFSVSNLGMFDIEHFTAIINPPEAGILAIGSIVAQPVVIDGQVVVRRRMKVTMSCDHRVIDGATGAKFLQSVKLNLENPLAMLL